MTCLIATMNHSEMPFTMGPRRSPHRGYAGHPTKSRRRVERTILMTWSSILSRKHRRCVLSLQTFLARAYRRIKQHGPSKRVFLKDISYHVIPPSHSPNATAPSLEYLRRPLNPPNPTLLPTPILHGFQFVFLIRKPSASMPSLYRCFIPPLSEKTGEHILDPTELGYRELRILFEYLHSFSSHAPTNPSPEGQTPDDAPILVDADDLLAHPEAMLQTICRKLDFPYSPSMLTWDTTQDHILAESAFKKYAGYHEDALNSTGLISRTSDREHQSREASTKDEQDREWTQRYGGEAAKTIREAVDICQDDYDFLYQFRTKPQEHIG